MGRRKSVRFSAEDSFSDSSEPRSFSLTPEDSLNGRTPSKPILRQTQSASPQTYPRGSNDGLEGRIGVHTSPTHAGNRTQNNSSRDNTANRTTNSSLGRLSLKNKDIQGTETVKVEQIDNVQPSDVKPKKKKVPTATLR